MTEYPRLSPPTSCRAKRSAASAGTCRRGPAVKTATEYDRKPGIKWLRCTAPVAGPRLKTVTNCPATNWRVLNQMAGAAAGGAVFSERHGTARPDPSEPLRVATDLTESEAAVGWASEAKPALEDPRPAAFLLYFRPCFTTGNGYWVALYHRKISAESARRRMRTSGSSASTAASAAPSAA